MSVMIRAASQSDYAAYARLFPELGVDDPIPSENLFARMAPTTLFAEVDGEVAGCLVYQRSPPEGFVNQLIVGANWRAQGIGARLMHDAAKILQAAGCVTWALNVKQRNAPARKLYLGMGMSPVHETSALRMTWSAIERLQPASARHTIVDVTTETRFDASVERTFDMRPGWLDKLRGGGEIVLKMALENDRLAGFAGFRPAFPCILAFNASDEQCAAGLLQAFAVDRQSLESEANCWRRDNVKIIIQRQTGLVESLCRDGADLQYMLDLMRGPLPPPMSGTASSARKRERVPA